jgi:porphobilinogen synthase
MLLKRPRRNRKTSAIRSLVQETPLLFSDFIVPFFIVEGEKKRIPISTLPGIFRLSIDELLKEAKALHQKGIQGIALFPCLDASEKDAQGSPALNPKGLIPTAIQALKIEIPSLCVVVDVALDPFTSHGHDGLVSQEGEILNDETVEILAQQSLLYAEAGADFVAPSDMMDGRVKAIRLKLDTHGLYNVGILAYTAKYASSLYAPFREALGSTLKFGDKKTYQMNPANIREAILEASLDQEEGADMLMVKPALFYLDVIAKMRAYSPLPICAYHVTGEYAMVMAAHEKGYLDAQKVFYEALLSIKRAGADFIFSYAVFQIIDLL